MQVKQEDHQWEFLAAQYYQQSRVDFMAGSSDYPMCTIDSGPVGADAGKDDAKCPLFGDDDCKSD